MMSYLLLLTKPLIAFDLELVAESVSNIGAIDKANEFLNDIVESNGTAQSLTEVRIVGALPNFVVAFRFDEEFKDHIFVCLAVQTVNQ